MKKSEKFIVGFCLLFLLTSLISFSQQKELTKEVIPGPSNPGVIPCDEPLIDQDPPLSPRWRSRHSRKYCGMVAGDYDSDGYDEVAFDFGSSGIWIYDPNAAISWRKISSDNPEWMIAIGIGGSDDELFVEWASTSFWKNSWWNYTGYPGTWTGISTNPPADYAYDAGDINADGDSEVVVQWDGAGIYVCNYTGSASYGGFDLYQISSTEAEGMTVQFGDPYYELLHSFSDGTKFWNYSSGYPSTNWYTINSASFDTGDSIVADVEGDTNTTDEFMADIVNELWLYDYDDGNWTRLNYNSVCEMYPIAFSNLGNQYEFYVRFCSVGSLWAFNPDAGTAGFRASWNQPQYVLGADFRTASDGGTNGEEAIADFGAQGVWYELYYRGPWTRLNWNNPQNMIQANLDSDPEMEIVFDFGSLGVWVWDGAGSGSGIFTRINYSNPEATAPLGRGDECGCDK